MTTAQLDGFFRGLLDIDGFAPADPSLNGLQVDNDGADFTSIAFAVDASVEAFERAAAYGAGLLFVHHGLFWGAPQRIAGYMRKRLWSLLDRNLALYAVHLPLDQHPELGNNAALAELLGMENLEPFGLYRGLKVGYKGRLKEPLTIQEAAARVACGDQPLGVYPFGKPENQTCAVVSGGAPHEVLQALEEGVDLYVTGASSHQIYRPIMEGAINMVAGGHYATEVWGVRRVMERCAAQLDAEVVFIDLPTGL